MRRIGRRGFLAGAIGALACHISETHAQSHAPTIIMLMRHAEDIGETGVHLSPQGRERAQALPTLFASRLPTPQVIIATRASKSSNRPVETVEPLSRQLQLPIESR